MRLLFSLLLLFHLISSDVSPQTFNDELRDVLQRLQPTLKPENIVIHRHLLAVLARYARIHKHFVQQPNGGHGYRYRFPDVPFDFDENVAANCSNFTSPDIVKDCLVYMAWVISPKTNWVLKPIDLLESKLYEEITDSAFSQVLTFVSIMCWATTNRLSFMEDIPCADKFYTKDPKESGEFTWDGVLNYLGVEGGPMHGEMKFHDDPFHCADLSFCPSPCTTSKRAGCTFERHLNIDLPGMLENRWNLTYPCPGNNDQIYRPDLDICVHRDDCMFKQCPANSVCEEGVPTSQCICALGYAPDDNGDCKEVDLSSIAIPWKSPYATDGSASMGWTLGATLLLILR